MIKSQYMLQIALQHPTCIEKMPPVMPDNPTCDPYFVSIGVIGYSPSSLTITKGGSVIWSNENPSGPVTVSSDTGVFDSGDVQPGHTFGHTFKKPGTYKYSDKHQPLHKGEIIVT
jgi:plastocyanin